jgi:hypothetical protein
MDELLEDIKINLHPSTISSGARGLGLLDAANPAGEPGVDLYGV